MPRIAREEENTTSNINWFTTLNSVKTDMYSVEFQIFRIEDGLPGTQIFPLSGWEDVSVAPGKFDTGSYYAYDNANSQGWTPEADAWVGTHRIFWRWKYQSTSSFQYGAEDFELIAVDGVPTDTYITVEDVKAALGSASDDFPDYQIETAIITWQQALDRMCRQWFNSRALTINFDGDNTDTIHLGVPIITCDYLRINNSPDNLDTSLYRVYNSRTYPDDRRNPKIRLRRSTDTRRSLFVSPYSRYPIVFEKGYQNHVVSGTFGFTESDGTTPLLIQRALLKLVIEKLTNPVYIAPGDPAPAPPPTIIAGVVIEEKTDGHSIKYGDADFVDRRVGLTGITQDQEILDIVKLYKAPIGIATPSHWRYY